MGMTWTSRETSAEMLLEVNEQRHITADIRKMQATFKGHVLRKGKLEDIVTTGTLIENETEDDNKKKIYTGRFVKMDGDEDCKIAAFVYQEKNGRKCLSAEEKMIVMI
jgi:hypothetical protein